MKMFLIHGERSGILLRTAASGYDSRKLNMSFNSSIDPPVASAKATNAALKLQQVQRGGGLEGVSAHVY
jgi:hypothetical protein